MAHPSVWVGVAGVLAFTIVPYTVVLAASAHIRKQITSQSGIPAALLLVLALNCGYRVWLWSLVPAEEKTLGYWNWLLLAVLIVMLTAAELKIMGITDALKKIRNSK